METDGRTTKGFDLEEREHGRTVVLRLLDHDLSYYYADALRRDLRPALELRMRWGAKAILLDMGRIRVIDSGGIGLILSSHNRCTSLGVFFALCRTSPFVRHVLGIVGAHRHVRMFETIEEGIEAIKHLETSDLTPP
jgi:anti-anti-sigma factor